jgi:hypothetical protein
MPVLDQFVAAAQGSADREFWQSLYKVGGDSGGPYVTGFVNVFFPYIGWDDDMTFNRTALEWSASMRTDDGPTPSIIPPGLSMVPFDWTHLRETFPMQFLGGFVGATQDPDTLAIRPSIGWAVADR